MGNFLSEFSGLKTLFGRIAKGSAAKTVQKTAELAAESVVPKGLEIPINLNNSNYAQYNKALINFKGPFTRIGKTLADVPKNESYFKYFDSGYPLLGKYVHQGNYSIVKYTGEIDRYIFTQGCGPCSKLTMYDPVNKVGFLAHVDVGEYLLNSMNEIKEGLIKKGAELKNLEVRHVAGKMEMPHENKITVREFLRKLGLKDKQLIEEDAIGGKSADALLDIKDGQTYELDVPFSSYYSKSFINKIVSRRNPKIKLSDKEILKMKKELTIMENCHVDYDKDYFTEM